MSLVDLCASVWALSAVRVAAETDLFAAMARGESDPLTLASAAHLDPNVASRILEVLEATGFAQRSGKGFVLTAEGSEIAARADDVCADLAATFGQARGFVLEARRSDLGAGWQHVDPEVIRAQSTLSRSRMRTALATMLEQAPELARLEQDGATFLDAGAGGAGVGIALCRRFPSLRVVGLEPLRAARLEAREAIALAGLSHRIEIRSTALDGLADERAYAGAFVAAAFMSDDALARGLDRLRRALVPGAAILLSAWRTPADACVAATSRLRWQLWGGGSRSRDDLLALLRSAGITEARELPAPFGAMVPVIARAPS